MSSPWILLRGFILVMSCLGVGRELAEESLGDGLIPGQGCVARTFDVELHEIAEPIFSALDAAGVEPTSLSLDLGEEQVGVEIEVEHEAMSNAMLLDFIEFPRQAHVMFPDALKGELHTPGPAVAMDYTGVNKSGEKVKLFAMIDPADQKKTVLQTKIGGVNTGQTSEHLLKMIAQELAKR